MYINPFKERIKIDCDQEHSSIDSNSLRAIIDFVYSGRIDLHVNTVQDILQTATILGKTDNRDTNLTQGNALNLKPLGAIKSWLELFFATLNFYN